MSVQLVLIPVTLGQTSVSKALPAYNRELILSIQYFVVEDIRSARRFLKQLDSDIRLEAITFFTLNKHTSKEELSGFLQPLGEGHSVGILSEAGCPAVADPGGELVFLAQQKDIPVVPLVGPSSILLALMASGFNGQNFAFEGYLPVDSGLRIKTLKRLEQRLTIENQTQIFIETPYRNHKLLEDIIKTCKPATYLCIAADITLETEWIKTKSIKEWKKHLPELSKRPCIFALGQPSVNASL
ncbi:MAG: SAM-dependent methyltransferase [Candidatus Azobacteroides sp.]|nr:SAM-dependent methyltransferase [Candidatus Azobacteroides sp.]